MGRGGPRINLPEIEETRAAGKDAEFEALVERIKSSAEDISDEETPLYTEVGMEQFETGVQRVIEFKIKNMNFRLTRKVEDYILQGAGRQKHLEEVVPARSHISLKRKSELSSDWQSVDLEDMF